MQKEVVEFETNQEDNKVYVTREEIKAIANKTGYSETTVNGVLRGYIQRLQRHQVLFDVYEKVKYLRELHHENYLKDLEDL